MRRSRLAVLLAFACFARSFTALAEEQPVQVPNFVEESASAGIDSIYAGDWQYMVGGGAATFDCNADGFPDIFLAGGEEPARFYRNASIAGGALKFVAEASGLELDAVTGAYPLDVDSDGVMDLVLLRVGENVVMRGKGGCKFERANEAWGFDGGDAWSTAFSATWERGADWPTLAVGNYIDRTQEISPWGSCTENWLHRPQAVDTRRFAPPLALRPSYCALSMLFTDWDRSGTPSLRVSNDREYYKGGEEQLWRVEPGQAPALYHADEGWKLMRIWGMGIASYDLNSDGYPEYFLTSMADNKLQSLAQTAPGIGPKPIYSDVAFAKGATAHVPYIGGDWRPSTAWHAQFEDVNNDGLVDLFIAKGNVDEMPDFAAQDPNNLLLQQPDGNFREAGDRAGVASMAVSRGGALTDFNLDGRLDLVVVNRRTTAQIWRNTSVDAGRWVEFKLQQPAPNRDGIGAWIEVRCDGASAQRREITVGGGHVGGQAGWWHFGIGAADNAEVRVVWPDGTDGGWHRVEPNKFFMLERGQAPRNWQPSAG